MHVGTRTQRFTELAGQYFGLVVVVWLSLSQCWAASPDSAPVYTYKVVSEHAHDARVFTQGLVYNNDYLYEGSGRYGQSSLCKWAWPRQAVVTCKQLSASLFGEGVTVLGDYVYQLTWRAGRGFVYQKQDLALVKQFSYRTEGWGLTTDGVQLIVSDGSDTLYFWDPKTLRETTRIRVFDGLRPVTRLNELEYRDGYVYANVWKADKIAKIKLSTGEVVAWIDLSKLLRGEPTGIRKTGPKPDVLNGIFVVPNNNNLFVTGKLWPKIFEIEVIERLEPNAF